MEKRATSHDPGWNDPPLFSYDEHTAQLKSTKPRTLLNKRISFPMESSSPPTASVDPTLPLQSYDLDSLPPPPFIAICPRKIETPEEEIDEVKQMDNDSAAAQFNSEEALACVVVNFNSVLNCESTEIKKNKNDIERRLDIMKKMWLEGKFNKDIQRKLVQLSEAVKERNYTIATDLQIGLMVDHPSLCSQWMSGVRYMIQYGFETFDEPSSS